MKKENYVSDELQDIFINNFKLHYEDTNQRLWFGRSVLLYILLIRIFKYKMENNIEINFNNTLEYLFDNYQILKEKELLSLEEIKNFEKFMELIPGVKLTPGKIEYKESSEEQFMYVGMSIAEYLEKSSFVTDFFHVQKNIENF